MGRVERLARTASAPLVPLVMARRIISALRSRGRPLGPWLPSCPGLSLLLAAWAAGEARGTWSGYDRSSSTRVAPASRSESEEERRRVRCQV